LFCAPEKARLQAEAKEAEEARRKAEAQEAKRKLELEREAARQALLEVNQNCCLVPVWFYKLQYMYIDHCHD